MRIPAAWGHDSKKPRKFLISDRTEDGEVMCETRLQKAQLLKKSFLFCTKNTNQKNKSTN